MSIVANRCLVVFTVLLTMENVQSLGGRLMAETDIAASNMDLCVTPPSSVSAASYFRFCVVRSIRIRSAANGIPVYF